jgi:hypothetical protein
MDSLILYSYLHYKIKSHCKTSIIQKAYLKENIGRILIRKGGLPRFMINHVIEDMEKLNLLKLVSRQNGYLILDNPNEAEIKRKMFID